MDEVEDKQRRSRAFYRARVAVLLVILVAVAIYAYRDVQARKARTDWTRTLDVAVVFVVREPVSPASVALAKTRTDALADHLALEMARYRVGTAPFRFHAFGPVEHTDAPPEVASSGFFSDARFAWDLWRYTSGVDDRAGLSKDRYDARIYVVLSPPTNAKQKHIEGASQQGGRVGIVEVQLDETMVDFALFVVAHELFHTLGATDKYDASARVLEPDGLAEPNKVPLYPQDYVELMARHRPIDANTTKPPKAIDELRVGRKTAREIGWAP